MTSDAVSGSEFNAELLDILACPLDHAPVREEESDLVCTKCGRRYPIENGIPNMLVDEDE